MRLHAVLLERGRLPHVVDDVGEHLGDADVEPVLGAAACLRTTISPSPSSITVGGVIQLLGL